MTDGNSYTCDRCYRIFRKQLWRAGIPHGGKDKGPRIHDLRHTFATLSLRQLVYSGLKLQTALQYLSAHLGHHDSSVTERYVHICPDLVPMLAETIERIASRVIPMEVKNG
jgi:integrase